MIIINIHQAKTNFSKLIEAAMKGEEVVIAKAGKPAAKLIPIIAAKPIRKPGGLKGKIRIADDFDSSLPDNILDDFEGNLK